MKNPFAHPAMTDISLLLARLTLGLYMLFSGLHKFSKPGLAGFANEVVHLRPDWLPEAVARPYGYALPFGELIGGLLLTVGLFTAWAGGAVSLILLSIFIAVVSDKGLAGGEPGPFHSSIIFAALAFVIAIHGPGRLALDPLYFGGGGRSGGGKSKD